MVASLRSPRRALVATFLLTSFFLLLALHHRDNIIRPASYDPTLFPPSENGKATTTSSVAVRPQEKEEQKGNEDIDQKEEGKDGGKKQEGRDLELVVASVKAEDTSWFHAYLPSWHKNIYVADDPSAPLTVPTNKGREAMVYLTYMIDRYDTLPANVLFVHASRFAWHNDDPDYDALPTLRNFRLPYLRAEGYVNLRCVWVIGCPSEIRPVQDEASAPAITTTTAADGEKAEKIQAKHIYKQAFEELLPGTPVPEVVAVSCCSQFGVTRETIRSRPKEDYIRYREWLLATPLDDALNGRVFEFAWHIIFGKEAVHCPSAAECYCNVFGLCDMAASSCKADSCDGRYVLPPYSTLPKGWPLVGWEEEARNFTGPL
ncbi:hypothetical protein F5Y07DRAFT_379716 [Xylaria sp. FL0933]|nr:hypothetical protein F5Y07DRAFT_379716 [Xylaria sp. FL0933]